MSNDPSGNHGEGDPEAAARFNKAETRFVGSVRGTEAIREGADVQPEELDEVFADLPFGIPDEPLPQGGGSGAGRAFSLPKYGLKKWRDVFTPRQLLALGVFA